MSAVSPRGFQVAIDADPRVGEGPVWDADRGELVWVDILGGRVHRTHPGSGATVTYELPTFVGAAAPAAEGGFVIATREGFGYLDEEGVFESRLEFLPEGARMNDAKCDVRGRFWAGSCAMDFTPGRGALHVLEPDWSVRTILDGFTLPNGLDWSPDGRTFYLVDTVDRAVYAFGFDAEAGEVREQRTLIAFDAELPGLPDGMCVDAGGDLWIAFWGGRAVVRVSAAGELLETLDVPVAQPSSCAFGGAELDVLYVTSAREGLPENEIGLDGCVLSLAGTRARGQHVPRFAGSAPISRRK
jgi:sugar lactone lactonase YvrE